MEGACKRRPEVGRQENALSQKIMKTCMQTGKKMYTRERADKVREHQEDKNEGRQLRIYCCEFCMAWHLTHRALKNG